MVIWSARNVRKNKANFLPLLGGTGLRGCGTWAVLYKQTVRQAKLAPSSRFQTCPAKG